MRPPRFRLLTMASPKIEKSNEANLGYLSAILYLHPGDPDICPHSTAECRALCLGVESGRGAIRDGSVERARRVRTNYWRNNPTSFLTDVRADINRLAALAHTLNLKPCVRLNGTSDLAWEDLINMWEFRNVQFYDYTKIFSRMNRFLFSSEWPSNYHLTYSLRNHTPNERDRVFHVLTNGGTVAHVFAVDSGYSGGGKERPPLPLTHVIGGQPFRVYDGDTHDLRFLDPPGTIVGLRLKRLRSRSPLPGRRSGFVTLTQGATS